MSWNPEALEQLRLLSYMGENANTNTYLRDVDIVRLQQAGVVADVLVNKFINTGKLADPSALSNLTNFLALPFFGKAKELFTLCNKQLEQRGVEKVGANCLSSILAELYIMVTKGLNATDTSFLNKRR